MNEIPFLQHRGSTHHITKIQKLFSEDLAKENDFLRQENQILRSKLGKRVPLTDADRRTLVRYGLPIKDRLWAVISIVRPETLLAWNRRMKRQKWTFDNTPMCNAYAERFVRETRETLDNLILLGERHSRHVLKRIEQHHNRQRPHRSLDNVVPLGFEYPDHPAPLGTVRCDAALGGLLNHYYAESVAA